MKTLVSLIFLTVILECFASPPLQLEDARGIRHVHKNKLPEISPARNIIRPNYILPQRVLPEKYTLRIRPILYAYGVEHGQEYTAPGHVEILVTCVNSTNEILIHRHPTLNITSTQVFAQSNNAETQVLGTSYQELYHYHVVSLASNLAINEKYIIIMDFVAPVSTTTTDGLYRAEFTNERGEIKRMATTQFESVSARQAFPCFDEPNLRATYNISIARRTDSDFTVLSNEGVARIYADPNLQNWEWLEFKETVTMPTYLVAMIVVEDYRSAFQNVTFDKPVGVYGPRHLVDSPIHAGRFAADASANIINFLQQEYAPHNYSLSKIDSISIPSNYFGGGAMENWGLNTYRQEYLLFVNGESSEINRYRISSILTHELAHQWFGNIVTCKWWSDLWLNEGFASYITFMGIHRFFPEFDADREILWDSVQYAMAYDVDVNEPVRNNAITPVEIEATFTTITYEKGASIIRMMVGFLGEETLRKGLVKYLEQFKFQGVEQDNLFQALNDQAIEDNVTLPGKTIKQIMDTWTLQPGYPLVRVSKVGNSRVYISQERFTKLSSAGSTNVKNSELWELPIAISTQDDVEFSVHTPKLWLSKNTLSQSYAFDSTTNWLVVNPDGVGFYRVLYDDALTQLLINQLQTNHSKISPLSRSQLIDDYFNLARNRYIDITAALELTTYLTKETDRVVWNSLLTAITRPLNLFKNEDISLFRSYFLPRIESALNDPNLGWDQPTDDQGARVLFRAKLIDWACALESTFCATKAKEHLATWLAAPTPADNPIPLDIQAPMYCALVAHGGDEAFDFVLGLIQSVGTGEFQRTRLLTALACSRDSAPLQTLLELTLDNGTFIGNNIVLVLQRIGLNTVGRDFAFNFIRERFDEIKAKTGGVNAFLNVLTTLSSVFTTESEKTNVETLIQDRNADLQGATVQITLQNILRNIDSNIEYVNEFYGKMNAWFQAQAQP